MTNPMEEGGPLAGQTILVTRAARQAAGLVEPLEALGATVWVLPAIEIAPPLDTAPFDEALRSLHAYDWVVMTSVNGVQAVRDRFGALGLDPSALRRRKLAAVGPTTAAAMREAFWEPDFTPSEAVGEAVAREMGAVEGLRILLLRADIARRELPDALRARGATVDDVAAYRTVRPDIDPELPQECPDVITLTSSSAVHGTRDTLEAHGRGDWMSRSRLVCIGPITAATVRELGYEVAAMAEEHTVAGLVEALVGLFQPTPSTWGMTPATPSPTVPPFVPQGEPSRREGLARA